MKQAAEHLFVIASLTLLVFYSTATKYAYGTDIQIFKTPGYSLLKPLKHSQGPSQWPLSRPDAPKGGVLNMAGIGNFDSFNPYSIRGLSPIATPDFYQIGTSELNETLLVGSSGLNHLPDETSAAYGLIAEWVEYPEDVSWVIFHLRPGAYFHDKTPITAEDVAFSFTVLKSESAHPSYSLKYKDVSGFKVLSNTRIRFDLQGTERWRLPLLLGELPILPKHDWQSRDIGSPLSSPALNSGPYRIRTFEMGRFVEFERVEDYWGRHLPINQGRFNFKTIRVDFYRDHTVRFESFKSGETDVFIENVSKNWAQGYDFEAVKKGTVNKLTLPNELPSSNQAFFFNTRKPLLSDRRVRHALGLMLDFEWMNRVIFYDAYKRNRSYFPNSDFQMIDTLTPEVKQLLLPFKAHLPPDTFNNSNPIVTTQGDGRIRLHMQAALALLKEAGWKLNNGVMTHTETQEALHLELLMTSASMQRVIMPYIRNLKRIGVTLEVRLVDKSVYKQRLDQRRYDIVIGVLGNSTIPGGYLRELYGSASADRPGANYSGIKNQAIDALIDGILSTKDYQQMVHSMQALDRILLNEWYAVPHWHIDHHRVAIWNSIARPITNMPYSLGIETWWKK